MFGKGIHRIVPNSEFLALINANNPSTSNPFATIEDVLTLSTYITVVPNYDGLPNPATVTGKFYWVENSQGTAWLPWSLGGTYYPKGLYYSNGISWIVTDAPYQASQIEVDAGTNNDKFVTPLTLENASKWDNYTTLRTSQNITVNYGLTNSDRNLILKAEVVITLPLLSVITHLENIYIINDSLFNCTINTTGGELLLDTTSFVIYPNESLNIQKGTDKYLVK